MAPSPTSPTESKSPPTSPTLSPAPSPVPPPVPVETHPNRVAFKPPLNRAPSDPSRLAPEDAYKNYSPPRLRPLTENRPIAFTPLDASAAASAAAAALRPAVASLRPPPAIPTAARLEQDRKRRSASRKRRQPKEWKKLLWVKHPTYPDNYTDPEKFLDRLQRNERLRPYDFWPLVADSTVIVQHVCSVALFICVYAGIYQDRISPISVVSCSTLGTLIGWIVWDYWVSREERDRWAERKMAATKPSPDIADDGSSTSSGASHQPVTMNGHMNGHANGHVEGNAAHGRGLGLTLWTSNLAGKQNDPKPSGTNKHSPSMSKASTQSMSPIEPLNRPSSPEPFPSLQPTASHQLQYSYLSVATFSPSLTLRVRSRLKTLKSATLIYFALLGLSPILKSLTMSTSSDSIWALATWLIIINIFFFDYGRVQVPKKTKSSVPASSATGTDQTTPTVSESARVPPFPSSLSTNAALMASTVLASRLTSTTHVFSLTLFSIEVFGLFPVFRRHLRHESWTGHVMLTTVLVALSSAGLGLILSTSYTHTYGNCGFCWGWIWHFIGRSMLGLTIGSLTTALVMGGCSWWLIGLQRYKNVVTGPWDPARPILAGGVHRGRGQTE